MLAILGYLLGFGMGLTLGVMGAGGSIMTVPILVYCFHIQPLEATGYSLLIVGSIALMGACRYFQQNLVDLRAALIFCLPAMLFVLITRLFIIPALPDPIWGTLSKDGFLMILLALLMLASAVFIFWKRNQPPETLSTNLFLLVACSSGIGLITGMVGAGGGFLIVPALIGIFGLPLKRAVGTSLTIIAFNSLIGFNGDLIAGFAIDWLLVSTFLTVTMLGMFAGTSLNALIESSHLSKYFAAFTLVAGAIILIVQFRMI